MRIFRSISISKSVLRLDFFLKFFEFGRCFEKGDHYSLSLNSSSENVLTTVSIVIRDGSSRRDYNANKKNLESKNLGMKVKYR